MQFWLLKSEPDEWSWTDQVQCGMQGEAWTGVRNYQARNFMKSMAQGDRCLFYHSGRKREIVGVVEIIKTYEPDPTDASGRFGMVTVRALQSLIPVELSWIKQQSNLQSMVLLRQPRLSVQPITVSEWDIIVSRGTKDCNDQ